MPQTTQEQRFYKIEPGALFVGSPCPSCGQPVPIRAARWYATPADLDVDEMTAGLCGCGDHSPLSGPSRVYRLVRPE
jgi:hypothetical protein